MIEDGNKGKNCPHFLQRHWTATLSNNADKQLLIKPKQHIPLLAHENQKEQQRGEWHRHKPHNCEKIFWPSDKRNQQKLLREWKIAHTHILIIRDLWVLWFYAKAFTKKLHQKTEQTMIYSRKPVYFKKTSIDRRTNFVSGGGNVARNANDAADLNIYESKKNFKTTPKMNLPRFQDKMSRRNRPKKTIWVKKIV